MSGVSEDEVGEAEVATGEARMMRLRGYGNSLTSEAGIAFIRAYMAQEG